MINAVNKFPSQFPASSPVKDLERKFQGKELERDWSCSFRMYSQEVFFKEVIAFEVYGELRSLEDKNCAKTWFRGSCRRHCVQGRQVFTSTLSGFFSWAWELNRHRRAWWEESIQIYVYTTPEPSKEWRPKAMALQLAFLLFLLMHLYSIWTQRSKCGKVTYVRRPKEEKNDLYKV